MTAATQCRQVFTLEAIAACEATGHRMGWVRAWHSVGWLECRRCGHTSRAVDLACTDSVAIAAGQLTLDVPLLPGVIEYLEPGELDDPSPDYSWDHIRTPRPLPSEYATEPRSAERGITVFPSPPPDAPPRPPRLKTGPKGPRCANAARDAEILRRVAEGKETKRDIAAAFGIHPSRISQIERREQLQ